VIVVLLAALMYGCGGNESKRRADVAAELRGLTPTLMKTDPGRAARDALFAQELSPTTAGTGLLFSVDAELDGVERVIEPPWHATVTALRTARDVFGSADTGQVAIWDAKSGHLVYEVKERSPVVLFAGSSRSNLVASVDADGEVQMWTLAEAGRPLVRPLIRQNRHLRDVLALGFSHRSAKLLALTRSGLLYTYDVPTGALLSSESITAFRNIAWRGHADSLSLTAAHFRMDEFSGDTTLLVASRMTGVARIDLDARRGRVMIPAGEVPGVATALAEEPYGEPEIVVGATGGVLQYEGKSRHSRLENGIPNRGVTVDESVLTSASATGIASVSLGSTETSGSYLPPGSGRPARLLADGPGGATEIGTDGSLSLLKSGYAGLNLPTSESTVAAAFMPTGELLETRGYDANHIEKLVTVNPLRTQAQNGVTTEHVEHTYLPGREWWAQPPNESPAWYVNDVTADGQYVVAGGQDPTHTAVVLVWDSRTGRPLKRLALTEGGNLTAGSGATSPSIVSQVDLLPGKHLLAAYSDLQEILVLWSTKTWEEVATVAVGPIADFSVNPSESTILIASLSDTLSNVSAGNAHSRLLFYDIGRQQIVRKENSHTTDLASFSPDGKTIVAVEAGGVIRLLDDSGRVTRHLTKLEDDSVESIAWKPGSGLLAVSLRYGGLRLVDPVSGAVSGALPPPPGDEPLGAGFAPTGSLLAGLNGVNSEHGYENEAPPSIWNLSDARLEERMCELSGSELSGAQRRHLLHDTRPAHPGCGARIPADERPTASGSPSATLGRDVDVIFKGNAHIGIATADGTVRTVASADEEIYPPPTFAWSRGGSVAWLTGDVAGLIPPRGEVAFAPCPCAGVAFAASGPIALENDASALLQFGADLGPPRRITTEGLPRYSPLVIGAANSEVVMSGYRTSPSRNTPSIVERVTEQGRGQIVQGTPQATVLQPGALSPSGDALAVVFGLSGGACYSPEFIAMLDTRRWVFHRARMPSGVTVPIVRSLFWSPAGALRAAIAPQCPATGTPTETATSARVYELRGGGFEPIEGQAFNVEEGRSATGKVAGPVSLTSNIGSLQLSVKGSAQRTTVPGISSFAVRP
jgi:WD40 repeat protein